jgi:hypothetical protein
MAATQFRTNENGGSDLPVLGQNESSLLQAEPIPDNGKVVGDLNRIVQVDGTVFARWVKSWKAILGLISALIAIPPGFIGLVGLLDPHDLEISAGKDLTISYQPQQGLIKLVFNVQAEEFGSKANQIFSAEAWVEQPSPAKVFLPITRPEFEENQARKYQPVIPAGPSPKNLQCSIAFKLDDDSREAFQSSGFRRFVVEFKAKDNRSHRVSFCFNIEDAGIDQLFNKKERQFTYLSEDPLCP